MLEFCKFSVQQNNFECFPSVRDFVTEINFTLDEEVSGTILQHLRDLRSSLAQYSSTSNDDNPFVITARSVGFNVRDYEILIYLVSDSDLKEKFRALPLTRFWSSLMEKLLLRLT